MPRLPIDPFITLALFGLVGNLARTLTRSNSRSLDVLWRIKDRLKDHELVILANREPFIQRKDKKQRIASIRPASGLVSALEPVIREVGGTWIAQSNSNSDILPPMNYRIERVALGDEEEKGYYQGFANEGLWPLCHLAYNRPVFRASDWKCYQSVNERLGQSISQEILNSPSIILIQDYHFALVAEMLRKRCSSMQAKIGLFWHIPWPSPDAFGICPWHRELLLGMLGADLIGFHTQDYCDHFMEACARYLKGQVRIHGSLVELDNHFISIQTFPIGIDPTPVKQLSFFKRAKLKKDLGIKSRWIAVGVDRLDYTKGLLERMEAVERFLDKNPEYVGNFTLLQIGSPSRIQIDAYRNLVSELKTVVTRINDKFATGNGSARVPEGYQAIVLLHQHYDWEEIKDFYQLGDICLVTSLQDGMNLVAKEYVLCQAADRGALVLSKFTGASRELTEAILVNPYSTDELADAIALAISLPPEERVQRMKAMKEKIQAYSAFDWAEDFIHTLLQKE